MPEDETLFDRGAARRIDGVELRVSDDEAQRLGALARLLLAQTSAPVALLDRAGRLVAATAGAEERGAVAGLPLGADLPAAQRSTLEPALEAAARGRAADFEGGSARPLVDEEGAVALVVVEWRPAAERRCAELEALRAEDARRFADVSHELRTPVALILGPVEALLQSSELSAESRGRLEVVRRNARTLLGHVHELFEFSRLESAPSPLTYRRVDLAALTLDASRHFDALAPARGIDFERDLPSSLWAELDAERLSRVVLNLLANAFEVTPRRGRVKLSLRATPEGRAELAVEDSGPGVPAALRTAVFERYRRGEGAARLDAGGLGLTIVKEVVDRHGGTIEVSDGELGGARFRVELPTRAPAGVALEDVVVRPGPDPVLVGRLAALAPTARPPIPSATGSDRPLALVVEDDEATRRFITESLAEELTIETANDGEEGLARALERRFDLVVTDVTMPKMSGDAMIHAMRSRVELDRMPILVLSGRTDEALRTELLRRGAQDYVIKPFSAEELRARARNLVAVKRAYDLLSDEVTLQQADLVTLAQTVTARSQALATAFEAMRVARDAAEAASLAKSRFLQLCSHELRTPLTTVLLQLEMLRADPPLGAPYAPRIQRLESAARRLEHLIEALLEHARLEASRMPLEPRAFELGALVRDVVEELRPRAGGLALVAERGEVSLFSDPAIVRVVALNLIDNAIKFTARGEVRARVARTATGARLEVSDTGPGIPLAARLRIFDAFEQLEDVRHKHTPGLGLGLTLVRRLVEALGGRIDLHTEVGRGSTFVVELPDRPPGEATRD